MPSRPHRSDADAGIPPIGSAPTGFRNWRAHARPVTGRSEFALYSDARFVSELRDLGPYSFINTIGGLVDPRAGAIGRGLVLRVEHRLPRGEMLLDPAEPRTQLEAYHGGWIDDELAALVSLSLGIRCRMSENRRRHRAGARAEATRHDQTS